MNTYYLGTMVRIEGTITNSAGTPVDPSSLTLEYAVTKPIATSVTTLAYGVNSIARTGAGLYYADIYANVSGQWAYRWAATGANAAATEGMFLVRTQNV
jgi:hypothetical protein